MQTYLRDYGTGICEVSAAYAGVEVALPCPELRQLTPAEAQGLPLSVRRTPVVLRRKCEHGEVTDFDRHLRLSHEPEPEVMTIEEIVDYLNGRPVSSCMQPHLVGRVRPMFMAEAYWSMVTTPQPGKEVPGCSLWGKSNVAPLVFDNALIAVNAALQLKQGLRLLLSELLRPGYDLSADMAERDGELFRFMVRDDLHGPCLAYAILPGCGRICVDTPRVVIDGNPGFIEDKVAMGAREAISVWANRLVMLPQLKQAETERLQQIAREIAKATAPAPQETPDVSR